MGHFKAGFGKRNETIIPQILKWSKEPMKSMKLLLPKNQLLSASQKEQGIEALPGVRDFLKIG